MNVKDFNQKIKSKFVRFLKKENVYERFCNNIENFSLMYETFDDYTEKTKDVLSISVPFTWSLDRKFGVNWGALSYKWSKIRSRYENMYIKNTENENA